MTTNPEKDNSTLSLLCESTEEEAAGNRAPIFSNNAIINSDSLIAKNEILANEAVEPPQKNDDVNDDSMFNFCDGIIDNQDDGSGSSTIDKLIVSRDGIRYTCAVCTGENKKSGDAKCITAHLKSAHDLCLYICYGCGDYFRTKADLTDHLEKHVAKEAYAGCKICVKIFTRLRLFCPNKYFHCRPAQNHVGDKPLLTNRPYICKVCKTEAFTSEGAQQADDRCNDYRYVDAYDCIEVEPILRDKKVKRMRKEFGKASYHKTHVNIQFTTKNGKSYACALCAGDENVNGNGVLVMDHLNEKHNLCFDMCDICGNFFGKQKDIYSDNLKANGIDFMCEICIETCTRLQLFRIHKHYHYLFSLEEWRCRHCNYPFSSKYKLEKHENNDHL